MPDTLTEDGWIQQLRASERDTDAWNTARERLSGVLETLVQRYVRKKFSLSSQSVFNTSADYDDFLADTTSHSVVAVIRHLETQSDIRRYDSATFLAQRCATNKALEEIEKRRRNNVTFVRSFDFEDLERESRPMRMSSSRADSPYGELMRWIVGRLHDYAGDSDEQLAMALRCMQGFGASSPESDGQWHPNHLLWIPREVANRDVRMRRVCVLVARLLGFTPPEITRWLGKPRATVDADYMRIREELRAEIPQDFRDLV